MKPPKSDFFNSLLVDAFVLPTDLAVDLRSQGVPNDIIRPYIIGRQLRRYAVTSVERYIIYTPKGIDVSGYPALLGHLQPYKQRLEARATPQEWYELQQSQSRYVELMNVPKIVYPDIAPNCRFTVDDRAQVCGDTSFAIPQPDFGLLAILNSRLANFYFRHICAALEGAGENYLRFKTQYVERFPIPKAGFGTAITKGAVQQMLDLHARAAKAKTDHERTVIERRIEATDREIDRLVYELYGLTAEEIEIVEGAVK